MQLILCTKALQNWQSTNTQWVETLLVGNLSTLDQCNLDLSDSHSFEDQDQIFVVFFLKQHLEDKNLLKQYFFYYFYMSLKKRVFN